MTEPDHPQRWIQAADNAGIFATAIESCKRNLGLVDLRRDAGLGRPPKCTWQDLRPTGSD